MKLFGRLGSIYEMLGVAMHRNTFAVILLLLACALLTQAQTAPVTLNSPNGEVEFRLDSGPAPTAAGSGLRYSVFYRGKPVIKESSLGLDLQGVPPLALEQIEAKNGTVNESYTVPAGKSNPVRNHYNWMQVDFMANPRERRVAVEVRAYDDGIAFRYVVPKQMWLTNARIKRELTQFTFAKDAVTYPLVLPGFISSYEEEYQRRMLTGLPARWLVAMPLLAELPGTAWVGITEANIDNYAGMYLRHESGLTLTTQLAPRLDDPEVAVIAPAPFATPWRVIMLGDEPGRLIESNIVINLNPPSLIADTSWIKPGKTSWDWWSGSYAENVPFKPGMNTETLKHYIDFSADSGFPYALIDEGWAAPVGKGRPSDLTRSAPAVDLSELLRHAKAKNVRLWLWAHWSSVDQQMDVAFPLFEKWGVAGVKIDFMDRDDQNMVGFYRRVLKKAAEHHLMINFHGAFKPDGVRRTYPNVVTREGVLGLEYSKWTGRITPVHNCTLPFTRMLAGPLDYTPGGFGNVTRENFVPRETQPMVMGTRAHQLAIYVVFESPLQMVTDYPERYRGQREFEFIKKVPTTWDETRVLAGKPMEFITMARRSGEDWFLGAMTDWNQRDIEVPLTFLAPGKYEAEIYSDAADADKQPTHTTIERRVVQPTDTLRLHLVTGGGAAIHLRPVTTN
ncbi:MAG TPA: glycoside hydrolase family 97 protein [Terriglobales bacterium]|nr:glycoside hydrolase family 97 protein [Terriglobales bacterium]